VRDYYKYYVAYETYDPTMFPDTPQWNAFSTAEEAFNNGMSPIFGGEITVIPAWLRIKPHAEFVAFANGARLLGFFGNQFFPKAEKGTISQGFWYLNPDESLRSMGFNSETAENPVFRGKQPRSIKIPESGDPILQSLDYTIGALTGLVLGATAQLRFAYQQRLLCVQSVRSRYVSGSISGAEATRLSNACISV
jgi:hypothetical protein